MSAASQPEPLKLPQPGGSAGAAVTLIPLLTAEILSAPGFLVREPGRLGYLRALSVRVPDEQKIWIPVPAFLVEHPTAGRIMIDTGMHGSIASDPKQQLGLAARVFTIRMEAGQAVPAQLRKRDVDPESVGTVIMTHLHLDHASAISEFTGARFILGQGEWEAATAPRNLRRGYVKRQIDHAVEYLEVDYNDPAVGSYASFGRSVDLFGDGSIRLCYTPGHSRGHQSVILRLADREVVLLGDAAMVRRNYREEAVPFFFADEHRLKVSLQEIKLYGEHNPEALIVPSHDHVAFKELEQACS